MIETKDNKTTGAGLGEKKDFLTDLKRRLKEIKTTRWIRFGIVSIIFFLFVIWVGNPWLLLVWLLLIDIYITGYIPWSWWKKKSGLTRTVMAWVDAIIYALILVYFIFAFIGQNYKIPSSSLEKSLLVGDYLWVSKVIYGPRVPQTPLHFPLAQHTLPILNTKSYIEKPQLKYKRLKGLRSVERGDIVVFNFPQGDTVLTKFPNDDYYMICERMRAGGISDPKSHILSNPGMFGKMIVRPVDRRENYVKRCVGLPGEYISLKEDSIIINGKAIAEPENVQYNYLIPVKGVIADETWQDLGIRLEDAHQGPIKNEYTGEMFYSVPLTKATKSKVEKLPEVSGSLIKESDSGYFDLGGVFPYAGNYGWTRNNTGTFWIPKKGVTLKLTARNLPIYRRAIETYEGNEVKVSEDGKIYINGKETEYYTFKMDYYWMMGDNRDRSLDSRYWGFVPEDHIVGSPVFIIGSFDEERSISDIKNKIRWDRFLKNPNPDKSKY